jgi:hypothetical protein
MVPVPDTLFGVISQSVSVIAGVVVAVATEPDTQFAVVTDTLVTVHHPHHTEKVGADVAPAEVKTVQFAPRATQVTAPVLFL